MMTDPIRDSLDDLDRVNGWRTVAATRALRAVLDLCGGTVTTSADRFEALNDVRRVIAEHLGVTE